MPDRGDVLPKELGKIDKLKISPSVLSVTPTGEFYDSASDKLKVANDLWYTFFNNYPVVFALSSLLPGGTDYSKSRMNHILLSNPKEKRDLRVTTSLDDSFEKEIVLYNLQNMPIHRALNSIIMFSGKDKKLKLKKVNNSRTRSVILSYLFGRDLKKIEEMFVKYKPKVKKVLRHTFGKDLNKILNFNIYTSSHYRLGRYAIIMIRFAFDKDMYEGLEDGVKYMLPRVDAYLFLREAAKAGDLSTFKKVMKKRLLADETIMGFRNTYKLNISLAEVLDKGVKTEKKKLQVQSAAKRAGTKVKVNYNNQDLYDLLKILYHKINNAETEDLNKINDVIKDKSLTKGPIDFGKTVVILDSSKSMEGSKERHLHPFLTGLCITMTLPNVVELVFSGGDINYKGTNLLYPAENTEIWKPLYETVKQHDPETVLIISDGFENTVKGMCDKIYTSLKAEGHKFNLIHINPVFAAKEGGSRELVKGIKPIPINSHKGLETAMVFEQLAINAPAVQEMLERKYKKLISL